MPIHDWSQVEAGIFHGFHHRWIGRLAEALTRQLSPNYYAEAEQHAILRIADVLALEYSPTPSPMNFSGSTAVLDTPARAAIYRPSVLDRKEQLRPKRVAIRHVSGHRVVALLEIVSPGNKDRLRHAQAFEEKVCEALDNGVHVAVVDLFPGTRAVPDGMPAFIWQNYDRDALEPPPGKPCSLGSFVGKDKPDAFFEFVGLGEELPALPLFLTDTQWVPLPLEETYSETFSASPPYLRDLLGAQ